MNAIHFETAFAMLNDELAKVGEMLMLICVGGYVMQLHGLRATVGVDAFFTSNLVVNNAIRKVGDKLGINRHDELWLNDSVASKNPTPPPERQELVHQFSNLTVNKVDMVYLMGMKLHSGREQDVQDVAAILAMDGNKAPLQLKSELTKMGFVVDVSVLLEAYGVAYGMDWLSEFYTDNELALQDIF